MSKTICALVCIAVLLSAGCAKDEAGSPEQEELSASQKELEQAPDEMLSSFSLSGYGKGGKKQWDLEGKSADIMTEEIKLLDVTGRVYGKDTNITIVADEGSLNRKNNNVHLEKNVVVTTDDGATLNTNYLDWDAQEEKLSNEDPVLIERGAMKAKGIGLFAQPVLNTVKLKKDVTVELAMQAAGEAQAFPTVITSDGLLEVAYQNNLAVFNDNVRVKDKRGEILADKMDIYLTDEAEGSKKLEQIEGMGIEKVEAFGDVEIHHGGNISYSQKAVYDAGTGRLTLTGQPKLVIYSTDEFTKD